MKDLSSRAVCQLWCVCDCFCGSGWILICNKILFYEEMSRELELVAVYAFMQ